MFRARTAEGRTLAAGPGPWKICSDAGGIPASGVAAFFKDRTPSQARPPSPALYSLDHALFGLKASPVNHRSIWRALFTARAPAGVVGHFELRRLGWSASVPG